MAFTAVGNLRSRAVMTRLGMLEDADLFDHPSVPEGHPLRQHVLYRMGQAQWRSQKNGDAEAGGMPVAAA